jgi:hypothetical protein
VSRIRRFDWWKAACDVVSPAGGRLLAGVRWPDVVRIQTFKLDLLTTDCIHLLFEFRDDRAPVRISEEWTGFAELFEPLAAAFPSIPPGWYMEVMTPAFETRRRVLYDAGSPGTRSESA